MRMTVLSFVKGHWTIGGYRSFPHVCPGPSCAVWAWLIDQDARKRYAQLYEKVTS